MRQSACLLANVYGSEIYDARKDPAGWNDVFFDDGTWAPAVKVEGPKGRLTAQGQPPIVVKKVCEAKLIARQEDGDLYDLGQNMSCMLEISVKGKRGDRVELLPAENGLDGKPFFRGAGFLPPIAPSYGKFIADTPLGNFWDLIAWGSFLILGAKWFYEYYGDLSMIRNYYGANCAYMDYLGTKITEDGFIAHGLGDWGNPQAGAQATANVETAFYYKDLVTMAEFAGLLGKQEDEKRFKDLAEEVRGNYNEKLLVKDPAGRWCYRAWDHREELFCTQACQALPLHFGMVPEDKKKDVTDTLLELLEPSGFVSGEIGFPAILQCLQESGHQDLIWKLAMREDTFSFYHFVQTGETALGEYWEDNPRSHNHDMMGSLMECYYTGIAGIRGLEPGFARAEIRPYLPNGIKRMKCSYGSAQGVVALEVDTAGADGAGAKTDTGKADGAGADGRGGTVAGGVTVSVVIPAGMEAELDLTALGLDVREHLIPGRYRFAPR